MALAIDTSLLTKLVSYLNVYKLNCWKEGKRSFQFYRTSALATVIHDASSISLLDFDRPAARQEALDWQPDPDDELDDMEVLYHLNNQAKSSPILEAAFSHTDRSIASTTVMTSCAFQPSSLPPSAQGRPLSSFHRSSLRYSWLYNPQRPLGRHSSISFDADVDTILLFEVICSLNLMEIILCRIPHLVDKSERVVVWQLQFDVVDFNSRRGHSTCRLQRRRRSTINPFHRVSAPRIQEHPPSKVPRKETKQIRGVRYREDHKRWTAEMKPPTYKNKVHFGEFKSHTQAARVVDVAFHYYGKRLNFSDTPHILEERPIPANINDEDKLSFVKGQAKWVTSIYSILHFPPSSGEVDGEGDDGTSQPQLSLHLEPTGGWGNNGLAEDSLGIAGVGGSVTNTLEAQQGLQEWRPSHLPSYSPTSSLCIIEDEDGAQHSTDPSSINLRSLSEPSCESHAQVHDEEQGMSGRMKKKRPRSTIAAHQFSPSSHQVAVAESSWRACTSATPEFTATFSPCPSDGDADQGDHGIQCEPQPWRQLDPMAGSTVPNRVDADGVDGVVTGTLQEQQSLSEQNVENLLFSSLRSRSSSIDIRDGEHPGASTSTNYGIPSQFSSESHGMPLDFLVISPPPSSPSSPTPYDSLSDHAQCLWGQQ